MKPYAPAVRMRRFVGEPLGWVCIEIAVFVLLALSVDLKAAVIAVILLPFSALGFLMLYGMAALAPSALHAGALGVGLGVLFVFLQGIGEGIGPDAAIVVFLSPIIPLLLFRAIHVYVSPLWTVPDPD